MIQPRTYTERIQVRIRAELRDALKERLGSIRLGAALRKASLAAIGRNDLILADDEALVIVAASGRRAIGAGPWVQVGMNVTPRQWKALNAYSAKHGIAIGAVAVDALLSLLGLPPRVASTRGGFPLGERHPTRPPR